MRRHDVATPALLLDLDIMDRNIAIMADAISRLGVAARPHAKSHKCVEVARRLVAAGAIGASCATIEEAEAMALGGIPGILITSPIVSPDALARLKRLLLRGADVSVTADNQASIATLDGLAAGIGARLAVIVELDVGVGRTGCREPADAVALARSIAASPHLSFAGVQAYWGNLQQVMPFAERARLVNIQARKLATLIDELKAAGLPPAIVTGAGTGTHVIDAGLGLFTEIQPGSFLFMDSCYGSISISENENPFTPSLFVAATVVSANQPKRVVVNAGFKAFATDSGKPVALRGGPANAIYKFMGDEHGALDFEGKDAPPVGNVIEFLTSHCDPTVNLYSAYHVVRGDEVVDIWPIQGRH
ncbi:DSD1 family PLP-dependent enzyme [Aestuariivirga sp.]|uniref:DSD1 family PLP-dependent enzyme n=1 Tax=Aestuariivirga sp. TaxID=2650926 RepID=UPI0039E4AFDD